MKAIVTGAGGFLGYYLTKYLKNKGYWVKGIDIKYPEFEKSLADEFIIQDLRYSCHHLFKDADEIYHLAADMGGIGYIETHKADIVFNNTMINMLTIKSCQEQNVGKFLFTSSACVYPDYLQNSKNALPLNEKDTYPAFPEDGYGWEKLMMERTCRYFREDYGLNTYVARLHNIYGELGTYQGGREKSPAALCRKIAMAKNGDEIEIWGNGKQTRSYCYVDDCVEGLYKLMQSDYHEPINIGTDKLVNINTLADIIEEISGKTLLRTHDLTAPQGVKGRNADITKAKEILNWQPKISLAEGLKRTYKWIEAKIFQL